MIGTEKKPHVVRPDHFLLLTSFVLVILSAVLSHLSTRDFRESTSELSRVNRVLHTNDLVLSGLTRIESAQRGYLLTGDPDLRATFDKTSQELPPLIAALRSEVRSGIQRDRMVTLTQLIVDKEAGMRAAILIRDHAGREAALRAVQSDQSRMTMERLRALCANIGVTENASLLSATMDMAAHQKQAAWITLAIAMSLSFFLVLATINIQKGITRRDQLIHDLETVSQHLRVTLASIADGVIVTDSAGRVTFLNDAGAKISGSPSNVQGKDVEQVLRLIGEQTRKFIDHPVRRVLRQGGPVAVENHTILLRADGGEVFLEDSAAPIVAAGDGALRGVVMVFRDISERRRAEESVRKWTNAFEHAGFGMAVLTLSDEPVLQQVNPAFLSIHGYPEKGFEPMPLRDFVSPESWDVTMKALASAEAGGRTMTETVHRRSDGSLFPALADVTVVRDPQGRSLYGIAYYSDISERARARDQLRRNEERFRTLADSLPHLVWTTLPDGTPDYFNVRWGEATAENSADALRHGWHTFLHPDDKARCMGEWSRALAEGTIFETEARLRAGAAHRWHICRSIPVRDSDGRIARWFGSCTDIHEQRQVAEDLRHSKDELQRSNLDLEQFAFAASHDLQEPLRMIVIYSQLLQAEYGSILTGAAATYLQFAVQGALRMETLIKDLLALSRATGSTEACQGGTPVANAVHKAIENVSAGIATTEGTAVPRFQVGEMPTLDISEPHLVRIFENLFSNAIKYTSSGTPPVISVSAVRQGAEWLFAVRDNGIGISEQFHEQIFGVFKRLHGADYPGTGIGLALCRRLIERAGGRIWVESEPGSGATFLFTLPATNE